MYLSWHFCFILFRFDSVRETLAKKQAQVAKDNRKSVKGSDQDLQHFQLTVFALHASALIFDTTHPDGSFPRVHVLPNHPIYLKMLRAHVYSYEHTPMFASLSCTSGKAISSNCTGIRAALLLLLRRSHILQRK